MTNVGNGMIEKHQRYIGPLDFLQGKTALVHIKPDGSVTAQFDDLKGLPHERTHGWMPYLKQDFEDVGSDSDSEGSASEG